MLSKLDKGPFAVRCIGWLGIGVLRREQKTRGEQQFCDQTQRDEAPEKKRAQRGREKDEAAYTSKGH